MRISNCSILVTGANGFIGKNLIVRLNELFNVRVITFVRGDEGTVSFTKLLSQADAIVHLAGENRPADEAAFEKVNYGLTKTLCLAIEEVFQSTNKHIPLIFASSIQAEHDNPYGRSKLAAEMEIMELVKRTNNPCIIFRFPGVFGKWCKPNYNSVVATFCYNIANNLPINVNKSSSLLRLVYIEDVVETILSSIKRAKLGLTQSKVKPEFLVSLTELSNQIHAFSKYQSNLTVENVGAGFTRALYSTYVSYLPRKKFSYQLTQNTDSRGVFVEMLKTTNSGQLSYFTALPGITRGGHYHHTKTEKFLVIRGEAHFRFRHLLTNELVEVRTNGESPRVVETIPGWIHDVTNIGKKELIVMLWANEIFDKKKPDTVPRKVEK